MTTTRTGPDLGFFGPHSVAWKVHGDPSLLIGGLRALLIQGLKPRAIAAVDQHSPFRTNFWGRLNRTSEYIMVTTFGDTTSASAIARRVREGHRRISGFDPVTGRAYRADEPELLLWVHAAEVDSFLAAFRRYGGRLSHDDADRYVAEMVTAAELMGLDPPEVPSTYKELQAYLDGVDDLALTRAAKEGMRLLFSPPLPVAARPLWKVAAAATIAVLPERVRDLYGLPWPSPVNPLLVAAVWPAFRAMNLLLPGPPQLREAKRRAG